MRLTKFMCAAACLTMLLMGCSKGSDKKMILDCFDNYKSAILNREGIKAYSYVDSTTRRYYEEILNNIRYATESETKNLPLNKKIIVTISRHSISKEKLKQMNGEDLFVYAVDHGWIGAESVSNFKIVVSNIDKRVGKTHIVTEKGEAPFGFSFIRENNRWHIDLTSMFAITEITLENKIDGIGVSEDEFIVSMLTKISGVKPNSSIWEPAN